VTFRIGLAGQHGAFSKMTPELKQMMKQLKQKTYCKNTTTSCSLRPLFMIPSFSSLIVLWYCSAVDKRELGLLHEVFMRASGGTDSLTTDMFVRLLPEFNNPLVIRSLFNCFADFKYDCCHQAASIDITLGFSKLTVFFTAF
jgi:hypothetical protein